MRQLHKELSHNDGDGVRLPKAGDGIAVKACVRLSPAAARRRAARPQHAAGRSIVPRRPHHLAHPRHGSCAVGCCGVVGGADTHTTAPAVHRYARRRRQAAALLCHALPDCGLLRGVHVLCGCCARACACVWVCTARVVSCFQVTTAAGPPAWWQQRCCRQRQPQRQRQRWFQATATMAAFKAAAGRRRQRRWQRQRSSHQRRQQWCRR